MHSLPIFVRISGQPVILVGSGPIADAKRRMLERAGAIVVDEAHVGDARLAIVALAEDKAAEEAVARLRARGLLVNAVDRPLLCDFTMPAIVDRNPVLVAISTGGKSAGLAAALRQRLEAVLPSSLGTLADALFTARARIKARWPDFDDRRRALGRAFDAGGALDPLQAGAADHLTHWLEQDDASPAAKIVEIVLTSSDPDDLTVGQARALAHADTVWHTLDVPPALLICARLEAPRIACTTLPEDAHRGVWLRMSAVR